MPFPTRRQLKKRHKQAYQAFDSGNLKTAAELFAKLAKACSEYGAYHYMLGLAAKYRRDWATSLRANQRAIERSAEFDEAAHWNAAIAATALHDWPAARRLWAACGIGIPEGEEEICANFGTAVLRLNAWEDGECVYARRIDPCRARITNVPLPESGYRFGDIVLHDGAPTGTRPDEFGGEVSVFNALERWQQSPHDTYAAFVRCPEEADAAALSELSLDTDTFAEDWTRSIRFICLRCSYGNTPHEHESSPAAPESWQPERSFGIAARRPDDVQNLLNRWAAQGHGREILEIAPQNYPLPPLPENCVYWETYDG